MKLDDPGMPTIAMNASSLLRRIVLQGSAVLLAAACSDTHTSPPVGAPAAIEILSGDGQAAVAGSVVPQPVVVAVTDARGVRVPGAAVTFAVTGGGGNVAPAAVNADGNGTATGPAWTLGARAGENTLEVSSGPARVTIRARGEVGPPAQLTKVLGDSQTALAGTTLPISPTVRLTDALGNSVASVVVTFTVTGGGGVLAGADAATDSAGRARAGQWTLGGANGLNTLAASVDGAAPVAFTAIGFAPLAPATAVVSVDPGTVVMADAPLLLGVSFDGRTSLNGPGNIPVGHYVPGTTTPIPAVAELWDDFPLTTVRYPGNWVNQGLNWKLAIGPLQGRPLQPVPGTSPQRVAFGFDEFMAMVESRGLTGRDVQVMVWIYPTATEANPVQSAADLVEYANAPHDGSNPGGGVDWAAARAANGRAAPYGIRTWNIGNEPWAPNEFNFQPVPYLAVAVPIIDAMRAIDPSIRITMPAVGAVTSAWNTAMLNSPLLAGKIHGLSPHAFVNDELQNPSPAQLDAAIRLLAEAAQARGLSIVLGDHAHAIPDAGSKAQHDLAMQWQGAVTTARFLLMLSQAPNIERANFWIYGAPIAGWYPIRRNQNGSYTLMPVARLYKVLRPAFHEQVLRTTVTAAAGVAEPRLRASAFRNLPGTELTVVLVNWDRATTHRVGPPSIAGRSVTGAEQVTAAGLTAETFSVDAVSPDAGGVYALPPMSLLILTYR
jgi:hypothetical protein